MTESATSQNDRLYLTGFDSAWGGRQKGAMCDLWIDKATVQVSIDAPPVAVTWQDAIQRVDTLFLEWLQNPTDETRIIRVLTSGESGFAFDASRTLAVHITHVAPCDE